jgi:FSR family fosmidomycin resistance protein-like MFS transporter
MSVDTAAAGSLPGKTHYSVLRLSGLTHFLNDATQSLLLPLYPLFKSEFALSFSQLGMISLTYQLTASLLQPAVGAFTDRRPAPFFLPAGMAYSLSGLLLMSVAKSYGILLLAAALLGIGTSVFHPESSRVARLASGGRFGLAQSIFQVGGNIGSSVGPLLVAAVILPFGLSSVSWFAVLPLLGICLLIRVSLWVKKQVRQAGDRSARVFASALPRKTVIRTLIILLFLILSKNFYVVSITNYFVFHLTSNFSISDYDAQLLLFAFLVSVAAGTLAGGPIGDRIGRKYVIWASILGIAPFTLFLPYADLFWTRILIVIIGFTLASAFPAIVVFAQELLPGHVGTVAGLFFGVGFGIGGIGAATLGKVADVHGIALVYQICSYLPLLGLLAAFLPNIKGKNYE